MIKKSILCCFIVMSIPVKSMDKIPSPTSNHIAPALAITMTAVGLYFQNKEASDNSPNLVARGIALAGAGYSIFYLAKDEFGSWKNKKQ